MSVRKHLERAEQYSHLKIELASKYPQDRAKYTECKAYFVHETISMTKNGRINMNDLIIGKGKLAGKGVYASRDFKKGEVIIKYNLKPLTKDEYNILPKSEKMFTHTQLEVTYLYSEPERYVNHSKIPNTYQDHANQADVALRDIGKGEMITTDATKG